MSYAPFIHGPGRVNDVVKFDQKYYKITHVEDFLSPAIGFNSTNNTWQTTIFNALAARGDTGFRDLDITNIQEARLLQVTGIEVTAPFLLVSLRQPAKMTRWGAGDVPEGHLDGFRSPLCAPLRLRNLFTVQQKPLQMRAQNSLRANPIVPRAYLRGFLYELDSSPLKATPAVFFEPPIGGIE